jgi:hypothetical protein
MAASLYTVSKPVEGKIVDSVIRPHAREKIEAVRLQPGAAALGTRQSHTSGVCAEERGLIRLRSNGVLVQPEMESWPSTLVSILPFSAGQLGGYRPMQWRLVARQPLKLGGLCR